MLKDIIFDWDDGNWPKCNKHGLNKNDIEYIFKNNPAVFDNPNHSLTEQRLKAIGQTKDKRYAYISFTFRDVENLLCIRPISARYMHEKEIRNYEQKT